MGFPKGIAREPLTFWLLPQTRADLFNPELPISDQAWQVTEQTDPLAGLWGESEGRDVFLCWPCLLWTQPYPEGTSLRIHIPEGEVSLPISTAVHFQVPCHT